MLIKKYKINNKFDNLYKNDDKEFKAKKNKRLFITKGILIFLNVIMILATLILLVMSFFK